MQGILELIHMMLMSIIFFPMKPVVT